MNGQNLTGAILILKDVGDNIVTQKWCATQSRGLQSYSPPQGLELEKTKNKGRGVICAPSAVYWRVPEILTRGQFCLGLVDYFLLK